MDIEFGYLVEQGLVDAAEAPEKARAVAQYCYEQAPVFARGPKSWKSFIAQNPDRVKK